MNNKQTSSEIASLASQVLRDKNSSKIAKSLAASAISQTNTTNQTGSEMETKASGVLRSDKYNDTTQALAASILSQSNKNR
ncbi:hypothetical protein [Poseidonibacter ostreae]|uniref:Uncharacterized protein n=1 Tax=Poseidonibacter ostreae TaxID=2654171 RepID=A0A6L4WXN6_9BACT|nr:hypothetical protein [Poseidonibacter ostreae]KAB7890298.1 hypothetical protein GBG19_03460 [Poseidonibacter ostreae]